MVRRAPGAGLETLEDGAPRGQLGRRREHVLIVLLGGIRRAPDPLTGGIEGRSSPVRKAARSPVAVGIVTVFAMVLSPQFLEAESCAMAGCSALS